MNTENQTPGDPNGQHAQATPVRTNRNAVEGARLLTEDQGRAAAATSEAQAVQAKVAFENALPAPQTQVSLPPLRDEANPPCPAGPRPPGFVRRINWRIAVPVLVAALAILIWRGVAAHAKQPLTPTASTEAMPVRVARVMREDLYNVVPIPAEFRPYQEVELHAKVAGYVRNMYVDFGDRVKSNQLLVTLEVPELRDELNNAIATEQKAEADHTNANLIYVRTAAVNKAQPNAVPQQEVDTAQARDRSTAAAIGMAKADVGKYRTLLDYTQIRAPFDGVITWRYVDPGALIQSGTASETQTLPLVRVSDNYLLRLDVPVSQLYVKDVHVGDSVDILVESLGGRKYTGKVTRTALRLNDATRTMITEIEVPNPKLEIVPGMYCRVMLTVQRRPQVLSMPIDALPPGYGDTVYVVNAQDQLEERPITTGLMTPTEFEVTSGLKEGELVLVGSRSQVQPGQKVEAKLADASSEH